ncbi:hypothetical protein SAMN06295945_1547 [Polynucleobacter meluiroseus]|uniref:Lon N-terminal domain-containing protein n=2 Tax=Polynucleobacter meluiroseus TaxID=1938814 RepID=A0A240E1U5_9BURK|nr:hypothetical protein SAMN06295945_1547 [Polynucleobacter meluiroseus]
MGVDLIIFIFMKAVTFADRRSAKLMQIHYIRPMNESNTPTQWLPLFPLGTVLFPGGVISLKIFEARYLDLFKRCLKDQTPFGVISIFEENEPSSGEAPQMRFAKIGTLAMLEDFDPIQPALYMTKSFGTQRFTLLDTKQEPDGLWLGQIALLDNDSSIPVPEEHRSISALLNELIQVISSNELLGDSLFKQPYKLDDCAWVSNRLAELLPIPLIQKNHLLSQTNPRIRLDLVSEIIGDQDINSLIIH